MKKKLFAVNTDKPNPEEWQAWEDVVLIIAKSPNDAIKILYPHIDLKEHNKRKPEGKIPVCEVNMEKPCVVMSMPTYLDYQMMEGIK